MKGFSFIALLLTSVSISAQFSTLSFSSTDDMLEARMHSAKVLKAGLHLIGPSLYQSNYSNGVTYEDIVTNNDAGGSIDVASLLESNKEYNTLLFTTDLHFGGLRYARSSWQVGADYSLRLYAGAGLPSELIELIGRGNAPFIGQRIDIAPEFRGSSYHQIGLSFAQDLGKFSYGLKANILAGVDDLHAFGGRIDLLTEEAFFQLNFDNDYLINSSATLDYESISDFVIDFDYLNFGSFFKSRGVSVDIGLHYKWSEHQELFFDVKDLGFIQWNRQVSNYISNQQYSYEGIDIIDFVENTEDIDVVDSLSTVLMIEETNNSYSYAMPINMSLVYKHGINDKMTVAASTHYHRWKSLSIAVVGLGLDYRWKDYLGFTTGYSYINQNPINIGIGFSGNWKGISYFVNTDNVWGLWSTRVAHIHMGGAISL